MIKKFGKDSIDLMERDITVHSQVMKLVQEDNQ